MSEIPGFDKIVKCEVEMMRGEAGASWVQMGGLCVRGGDEGLG